MNNKQMIGLCGRSGSGKSYVCGVFADFGGVHLDTDKIYHDLLLPVGGKMSECTARLCDAFGDGILAENLTPDRRKLSAIVFSDKTKLSILNRITHKYIFEKTMELANASEAPFAVMDAPVLFESGFNRVCDFTVCVIADDETCIKRITERDGIGRAKAVERLKNQLSAEELAGLCDFSVVNDGKRDVAEQIKNILIETGLYHEL